MADITKRLHYFNGQFLEEKDFSDEQEYHLDRQRRHNRLLHTSGIAEGLTVTGVVGAGDVTVGVGTALDNQGRMIVLGTGESLSLNSFPDKTVLVVISYDETGTDPATVGNQGQPTRWEEQPKVQLVEESAAPSEGTHVRLARVEVSGDRTISSLDTSVRRVAGVRVGGELAIPRLQISSEQLPDNRWPELTCDDNRQVRVDEHLAVSGDLTAGTISTPGGLTAAGVTTSGSVSAANVTATGAVTGGSLTTAGNVSAAGITASGTLSGANITTTGTLTAGNVTTTGTLTLANFATSGDVTIGGTLTVNGGIVGGGLLGKDTVQSQHIVDAAVTTDKLADYAVTTNEIAHHAVNNSKLSFGAVSVDRLDDNARSMLEGALQEKGYALRRRGIVVLQFSEQDTNGALRPIDLGFSPRIILASGFMVGTLAAVSHGGVTSGFVEGTTLTQYSAGPNIQRLAGPPYSTVGAINSTASCARGIFLDSSASPARGVNVEVVVDSISSTGLVARLVRTTPPNFSPLAEFLLRLNLYCMGI